MKALLTAAAMLALSACDTGTTTVAQQETANAPGATGEAPGPAPTATETATATPTHAPTATPTVTSTAGAKTIPAAALGRWGLVPADCTSTRGDAKGLLVVEPALLRFYESRGVLKDVREASDTRIRAAFEFSGEGMTWQRDETLDVQDGGKTLVRREYGDDAQPGPFKYTRC